MDDAQRRRSEVRRLTEEMIGLPARVRRDRRLRDAEIAWWTELALDILDAALPLNVAGRIARLIVRRAYRRAHTRAFGSQFNNWTADAVMRRDEGT